MSAEPWVVTVANAMEKRWRKLDNEASVLTDGFVRSNAMYVAEKRRADRAEAEVERLRAEREALRSPETREQIARALFIYGIGTPREEAARVWDGPGVGGRQRWYDYADAVLSVLLPKAEESR